MSEDVSPKDIINACQINVILKDDDLILMREHNLLRYLNMFRRSAGCNTSRFSF